MGVSDTERVENRERGDCRDLGDCVDVDCVDGDCVDGDCVIERGDFVKEDGDCVTCDGDGIKVDRKCIVEGEDCAILCVVRCELTATGLGGLGPGVTGCLMLNVLCV